ncbi:MAG: enoyl-CoA hydratase/isomerase family protein [Synergistes jonesii]|uniref:enoyl-CoA hydratase/isomerase family protein n=1 Tax=Synergistes jonesii TaxID=2754 RepID=UPI002A75E899|nr:enoyl-CoA hydratase/isomerase family protein [Synergistes jonesii]MDY2985587.1 enoyl-CoA hydratase/isomerase family protein [Synergistes jonesii]
MASVEIVKEGYIGYIVLNRPEKLNAFTWEMYGKLCEVVDKVEEDDEIRVVIIKGAGRCFSAGFDLAEPGMDNHMELRRRYDRLANLSRRKIWNLPKPTIAQVHSHCLGGGHEVALSCDFCFVEESANMGVPEIKFGLGSAFFAMPYMINLRKCREYLLTGKSYNGKTAEEIGIANKCVPLDELDSTVREFAKELAMVPFSSMTLQKRAINRAIDAMGFACQNEQWIDYSCLGVLWKTEEVEQFNKQVAEHGIKAAIKWRNDYFENMMK